MTPEQINLIRKSFDALWPFRRKLAEQFYDRFFELAPDARRLSLTIWKGSSSSWWIQSPRLLERSINANYSNPSSATQDANTRTSECGHRISLPLARHWYGACNSNLVDPPLTEQEKIRDRHGGRRDEFSAINTGA
jgi:hypothetical protein